MEFCRCFEQTKPINKIERRTLHRSKGQNEKGNWLGQKWKWKESRFKTVTFVDSVNELVIVWLLCGIHSSWSLLRYLCCWIYRKASVLDSFRTLCMDCWVWCICQSFTAVHYNLSGLNKVYWRIAAIRKLTFRFSHRAQFVIYWAEKYLRCLSFCWF